jgi:hypothetical protein
MKFVSFILFYFILFIFSSRIKVVQITKRDGSIVLEVIAKCIDYGTMYKIPTTDLIKLPSKFKELPPQVNNETNL